MDSPLPKEEKAVGEAREQRLLRRRPARTGAWHHSFPFRCQLLRTDRPAFLTLPCTVSSNPNRRDERGPAYEAGCRLACWRSPSALALRNATWAFRYSIVMGSVTIL